MKATTLQSAILTNIHFQGIAKVKANVKGLANELLCSEASVRSMIRKVEKGEIVIMKAA